MPSGKSKSNIGKMRNSRRYVFIITCNVESYFLFTVCRLIFMNDCLCILIHRKKLNDN